MTPEQFCYWLQGRAELMPQVPPSLEEWKMIKEHLNLTFKKVTPNFPGYASNPPPADWGKVTGPYSPQLIC